MKNSKIPKVPSSVFCQYTFLFRLTRRLALTHVLSLCSCARWLYSTNIVFQSTEGTWDLVCPCACVCVCVCECVCVCMCVCVGVCVYCVYLESSMHQKPCGAYGHSGSRSRKTVAPGLRSNEGFFSTFLKLMFTRTGRGGGIVLGAHSSLIPGPTLPNVSFHPVTELGTCGYFSFICWKNQSFCILF